MRNNDGEYTAIVNAGLILQLDDPRIAENWDRINPEPSVADYRKFTMARVEALNHAIRDLPRDRIRFHLCWGSWHGPHTTDIPMRDIVDVLLAIECQAYVFEAFADAVGKENVVASTDCGLGGRVHPQIAWAKLESLVAGAELASRRLWR
jgi:5-methyltetrahydropteroyltriglutamate--homocysteine methyltransferase